jgi:hypothetical protein
MFLQNIENFDIKNKELVSPGLFQANLFLECFSEICRVGGYVTKPNQSKEFFD